MLTLIYNEHDSLSIMHVSIKQVKLIGSGRMPMEEKHITGSFHPSVITMIHKVNSLLTFYLLSPDQLEFLVPLNCSLVYFTIPLV